MIRSTHQTLNHVQRNPERIVGPRDIAHTQGRAVLCGKEPVHDHRGMDDLPEAKFPEEMARESRCVAPDGG